MAFKDFTNQGFGPHNLKHDKRATMPPGIRLSWRGTVRLNQGALVMMMGAEFVKLQFDSELNYLGLVGCDVPEEGAFRLSRTGPELQYGTVCCQAFSKHFEIPLSKKGEKSFFAAVEYDEANNRLVADLTPLFERAQKK